VIVEPLTTWVADRRFTLVSDLDSRNFFDFMQVPYPPPPLPSVSLPPSPLHSPHAPHAPHRDCEDETTRAWF
jgi:hypothetical protein